MTALTLKAWQYFSRRLRRLVLSWNVESPGQPQGNAIAKSILVDWKTVTIQLATRNLELQMKNARFKLTIVSLLYTHKLYYMAKGVCLNRWSVCHNWIIPRQIALFPLHVALAWHFLTADPPSVKPKSQENSSTFGNVVADPCKFPFRGADSRPQSTAKFITTPC